MLPYCYSGVEQLKLLGWQHLPDEAQHLGTSSLKWELFVGMVASRLLSAIKFSTAQDILFTPVKPVSCSHNQLLGQNCSLLSQNALAFKYMVVCVFCGKSVYYQY